MSIPNYPTVEVALYADGSAHVNVSGAHYDLPADELAATRAKVTELAAKVATKLGRPVRLRAVEDQAEWICSVTPGGTVADLTPPAPKTRRLARKDGSTGTEQE